MPYSNFEQQIASLSFNSVAIATVILVVLILISLLLKKQSQGLKTILFSLISLTVILTTLYLASVTIYLNNISFSGGPVHYHADLEIWDCRRELNLKDPQGLSNKIGTPTLHEHNDKRIHLEGVVVEPRDASLGKFFNVIGGNLSPNVLVVPTEEVGKKTLITGQNCPNGEKSELQVFAYQVRNNKITQTKLTNPSSYTISPESQVPPADCIIIEFDKSKQKTDRLCRSFQVAKSLGKIND